jgi:hypothetical protein
MGFITSAVNMEISGTPPAVQDVWVYRDDDFDFSVHMSYVPAAVLPGQHVPPTKPFSILGRCESWDVGKKKGKLHFDPSFFGGWHPTFDNRTQFKIKMRIATIPETTEWLTPIVPRCVLHPKSKFLAAAMYAVQLSIGALLFVQRILQRFEHKHAQVLPSDSSDFLDPVDEIQTTEGVARTNHEARGGAEHPNLL